MEELSYICLPQVKCSNLEMVIESFYINYIINFPVQLSYSSNVHFSIIHQTKNLFIHQMFQQLVQLSSSVAI